MRKSRFSETQIVGDPAGSPIAACPRPRCRSCYRTARRQHPWATCHSSFRGSAGASTKVKSTSRCRTCATTAGSFEAEHVARKRSSSSGCTRTWRLRARGHQGCPAPKIVWPSANRQLAEVLVQEHRLPVLASLSVSNSSSGRRWKLDHAPAVGDPTHMVEFGTGRRAFAREA